MSGVPSSHVLPRADFTISAGTMHVQLTDWLSCQKLDAGGKTNLPELLAQLALAGLLNAYLDVKYVSSFPNATHLHTCQFELSHFACMQPLKLFRQEHVKLVFSILKHASIPHPPLSTCTPWNFHTAQRLSTFLVCCLGCECCIAIMYSIVCFHWYPAPGHYKLSPQADWADVRYWLDCPLPQARSKCQASS